MNIEIVDLPYRYALITRETCGHDRIGNALSKILGWCHKGAAEHLAHPAPICRYTRWDEADCDIEGGFLVREAIEPIIGTKLIELPQGRYVRAEHVGVYDDLINTHNAIHAYMHENGLEFNGPPFEHYLSDPEAVPLAECVTHVYCPVKD